MELQALLIFLATAVVVYVESHFVDHHHYIGSGLDHYGEVYGNCPDNWNELPFGCWRDSDDEMDFMESVHYCMNDKYENGMRHGLITVGAIRQLRVNYTHLAYDHAHAHAYHVHHGDSDTDHYHFHHVYHLHHRGPYRVNAVKGGDGVWREYPSGLEVLFHQFPTFQPHWGDVGETLMWDPHRDMLYPLNRYRRFRSLCHRPKTNICKRCDGFEFGHECSDGGDCVDGECICDEDYSGAKCQIPPCLHEPDDLGIAGQQCMFFGPKTVSYYQAEEYCDRMGLRMPVILSDPQQAILEERARMAGLQHYFFSAWLGGNDWKKDGKYHWITGSVVGEGFQNWNTGEPNNGGGSEHCASVTPTGTWNDLSCTTPTGASALCKVPYGLHDDAFCDTSDGEPMFCFLYNLVESTHADAITYCTDLGGYLADIFTQTENDFAVDNNPTAFALWLSMDDTETEGNFVWLTGLPLNPPVYWARGNIGPQTTGDMCMAIDRMGQWVAHDCCVERALPICVKNFFPTED